MQAGIKSVGASAIKLNQGIESLARTDDMLAVIGIIMLVGVFVSSFGAFWQGKLAKAQFKNQCSAENPPADDGVKSSKRYTAIMTITGILLVAVIIYIFRKQISDKFKFNLGAG